MCTEPEFFVSGRAEFDIKSKKTGIRPNIFKNLFSGYAYDSDCIYINGTGTSEYEFYIQLNRCGTLGGSDHNKKRDAKYKNTEPTVRLLFLYTVFYFQISILKDYTLVLLFIQTILFKL